MSETDYDNVKDVRIPHEAEHADATDAQMRRTSDHAAIEDVEDLATHEAIAEVEDLPTYEAIGTVGTASETYDDAEANAAVDAINAAVAALVDNDTTTQTLVEAVNAIASALSAAEAKIATLVDTVNELTDVDRDAELVPTEEA
jgi:ABC-type transporter Mla subunit MlaD